MNNFDIVELARRLANLITTGTVQDVRLSPYAVKVSIGQLLTTWLPVVVSRAGKNQSWDPLEEGEQVLVFSPDGDLAQGWVCGAGYSQNHPAPSDKASSKKYNFADGASIEYDRQAHHFNINLPAGATVNLSATGGITFTGDLTVNGNIQATGDVADKTRSMADDRTIFNNHTHTDVMAGSAKTGKPEQQQ